MKQKPEEILKGLDYGHIYTTDVTHILEIHNTAKNHAKGRALELGSYLGHSTLAIAMAGLEVVVYDTDTSVEDKRKALLKDYKVEWNNAPSSEALNEQRYFEFIFHDSRNGAAIQRAATQRRHDDDSRCRTAYHSQPVEPTGTTRTQEQLGRKGTANAHHHQEIMTPKTFIFCHDADIVKDCINEGRFDLFDEFRWVMLGPRDFSSIASIPGVIIARDLPDNIEHHRNLVAWTGWYALARNGYIQKGDIVNLFEYDITYNQGQFRQLPQCGYFEIPVDVVPYWGCGNNFEPHIKTLTGKGAGDFWAESVPVTSNYTLVWDDAHLQLTLDCITKGLTELTYVGHVLERAYSQHFVGIPMQVGAFKHAFANSHGF